MPAERQGREKVLREAAVAKKQREMDIWETRCRLALRQVCWGRVDATGRWAVDTLQWRLNKIMQHQSNRGRGSARVREGDQVLITVCWHIRVLERSARRAVHAQVQQAWTRVIDLEGLARVTRSHFLL